MIVFDTNVIIDLLEVDAAWQQWSIGKLESAEHPVVTMITLAETAGKFTDLATAQAGFWQLDIAILPLTDDAAFRAGQAFLRYRKAGGKREKILADFLIGAQASSLSAPLVTRDAAIYRTYFPELSLITPEDDHG